MAYDNPLSGSSPMPMAQPAGQSPLQPQGPQGQIGASRPPLRSLHMDNLDNAQGGEKITFTFADGTRGVETFRELFQVGVDPKAFQAVLPVIEDAADKVYQVNQTGSMQIPPPPQGQGNGMGPG